MDFAWPYTMDSGCGKGSRSKRGHYFLQRSLHLIAGIIIAACASFSHAAVDALADIQTTTAPSTPSQYIVGGENYTFGNGLDLKLTGVTTIAGVSFVVLGDESRVIARTLDNAYVAGGLRSKMFAEVSTVGTGTRNYVSTFPSTAGAFDVTQLLGGTIINRGALDVFLNAPNTSSEIPGNIERVDFIYDRGVTTPANAALLTEGGHIYIEKNANNPAQVAAILELDLYGNPARFGPLLTIPAANMQHATIDGQTRSFPWHFLVDQMPVGTSTVTGGDLYTQGGNPSYQRGREEFLGGAIMTFSDLGLAESELYFGLAYFDGGIKQSDVDTGVVDLVTMTGFDTNTISAYGGADFGGGLGGVLMSVDAVDAVVLDTDRDGVGDVDDLDDDNDGVPDSVEGLIDSDNDGIPNSLDIDSDNDGISDTVEAGGLDANGDGRLDSFIDANGDGVDDAVAATPLPIFDTDNDLTPDYLDLDSDNDSLADLVEAGGIDANGDGLADNFIDKNADGLDDSIRISPLPIADTDGDNQFNFRDVDSDNDGVLDSVEATNDSDGDGIPDYKDPDSGSTPDSDQDGIDDAVEAGPNPSAPTDTDADGIADYLDLDSDGDGISDIIETNTDSDGDGSPDRIDLDSDNDGIIDSIEGRSVSLTGIDTDSDGIDNAIDADVTGGPDTNNDGIDDALQASDTDNDGVPDYLDLDSDNDNIPDSVEGAVDDDDNGIPDYRDSNPGQDTGIDSDSDGISDFIEGIVDTDGDGVIDSLDLDSDNDGIYDSIENAADTDSDGVFDRLDLDSDNDGQSDLVEAGRVDTNGDGLIDGFTDANNDGVDDNRASNTESATDTDADGTPDYLDQDSDNDGIDDAIEGALDSDADGIINSMDSDSDNDGLLDSDEGAIDTDGDNVPDYLDLDSDNDGLTDLFEAGGVDADGNGRVDEFTDSDGDGADDLTLQIPLPIPDHDNDLVKDYLDLDSDNDSLLDLIESGVMSVDQDGDGRVDSFIDSNQNGRDDTVEALPFSVADNDGDGTSDYLDLDSDNDGEFDLSASGAADIDNNGMVDSASDEDQDGIPDLVDVDITGGRDADADGIDDLADADFSKLPDSDGDGIIDSADPDPNGDGRVGAIDDSPFSFTGLSSVDVNSVGAPAGVGVYTGLDGEGCSISDARDGKFDPSLIVMCLIAFGTLRRRNRSIPRTACPPE